MAKKKTFRLGDLQLRIMKVLWSRGDAAVSDVMEHLEGGGNLAYTTVATMLRKMEVKGLVAHRAEGRAYIYRAQVKSGDVSRSMTDHLVDRLFQGSLTSAVHHLLETRDVSREELVRLEKLIEERKRNL